jgi:hypothetical protein
MLYYHCSNLVPKMVSGRPYVLQPVWFSLEVGFFNMFEGTLTYVFIYTKYPLSSTYNSVWANAHVLIDTRYVPL